MIVVFGSINADLVANVATLPREGETQLARGFAIHAGGKGANQALAARRAGADVALAGAVGRDDFAQGALALLRAEDVDLSRVAALEDATGLALIHVDDAGRNAITVVPGANARVRADAVEDRVLDGSATVVMQLEVPLPEVTVLARRAKERGARVVLNAAPPVPLPDSLLDDVDVLVVNEHEAAEIARATNLPDAPEAFCAAAADRWSLAAVVTLGSAGLVAADPGCHYRLPACRVGVVDTTAAGDSFVGAFAAALDRGASMREGLADGSAAGAHACTGRGAQPSIGPRSAWRDAARALAAQAGSGPR